jgi:Ca-activated chloride channel family protein
MRNTPELTIQSKKSAIIAGHTTKVQLLCKLLGADTPTDLPERSPLHLSIVLDRSGSMSGRPLEEAKKCAGNIVKRLNKNDKVSIVTYDNKIEVVTPLTSVEDRQRILAAISPIVPGGMTNLFGGWQEGVKQLKGAVTEDSLSRVLILSDGCTNKGITDTDEIVRYCTNATDHGITTSTYGLGDSFNEELMIQMANGGGGSSYYGETADDLDEPFSTEFDLLSSLCAKNIFMNFDSKFPVKVLNSQVIQKEKGFQLNNLPYEGAVWLAFEIEVTHNQSEADDSGQEVDVGTLKVEYTDLDGETHTLKKQFGLSPMPSGAYSDLAEDPEVAQRLIELKASELQTAAKNAARNHDWDTVDALVKQVVGLGQVANNAWIMGVAGELKTLAEQRNQRMFAKEAMYSSRRMQKRHISSLQYDSSMDMSIADEADGPSFLSRKSRQGRAMRKKGDNNS